MKTFKTILLIVAITFSSVLSASTEPTTTEINSMTKEIKKLLKSPSFKIEQDIKALVTITFNQDKEIVVLHIDSESMELEDFIKTRLNYNKFSNYLVPEHRTFVVPIRLTLDE